MWDKRIILYGGSLVFNARLTPFTSLFVCSGVGQCASLRGSAAAG